jgi:hypothetical protein
MKQSALLFIISILCVFLILSTSSCEKLEELTGSSKPGKISGVITDSLSGEAISGVTVTTVPPTTSVQTDNDGAYLIEEVEKGDYIVKATKQEYNPKTMSATVSADKTTIISMVLAPTVIPVGTIQGTVISSAGSAPVVGANITTNPATKSATSDSQGKFTIANIPVGSYTVNAAAPGYQNGTQTVQVTVGDTSITSVILTPSQTAQFGSIRGKVTNASTSAPIANADIFTTPATVSARCDINGDYVLNNIPVGSYTVTASMTGFSSSTSSPVSVTSGAIETANLQLTPMGTGNGSLRVTVLLSHQGMQIPIPDVQITVTPGNLKQISDTSGRAVFSSLPYGQYTVRAEQQSLVTAEQSVTLSTPEIVDVTMTMTIRPDAPGSIEGYVRDANTMSPIQNATLVITTFNNLTTYSGSDGFFQFDNVSAGQHSVTASTTDGLYQSLTIPVPVAAGTVSELQFMLVPSGTGTGRIFGKVLDETGKPVPAHMTLTGPQSGAVAADAAGQYEFPNLPFGAYEILAERTGYVSQRQSVTISSTLPVAELNFGLLSGGSGTTVISGRIINTLKLPEPGVLVELPSPELSSITNLNGIFELKGSIPPGIYQLKITKDGFVTTSATATVNQSGESVWIGDIPISSGGSGLINISGKTVSITSMRGVANTSVSTQPVTSTVLTTSDGSFSINNVNSGTYAINLAHTKYVDYRIEGLTFPLSYPLDLYMFYGKYTTSQTGFYPMVDTWQEWFHNYWGPANPLQNFGTMPTTNRFGNANHARQFTGGQYLMTSSVIDTAGAAEPVMISFWTKLAPSISRLTPMVAWSNSMGNSGWFVAADNDAGKLKLQVTVNNTNGTFSQFDPIYENDLLDKWIMITVGIRQVSAGTYQAVLYLNGLKKLEQTISLPDFNLAASQLVAGRARRGAESFQFLVGSIDDIRLFRSFLTDGNIADLFIEE